MPLKPGYSRDTVAYNIQLMLAEKYPPEQAKAAALENARKSYFKRYPQGFLPPHLKLPKGRRDRAAWDRSRRRPNPTPNVSATMIDRLSESLANEYRARGRDAANQLFNDIIVRYNLSRSDEIILGGKFKIAVEGDAWSHVEHDRKTNPVPESSKSAKHSREARIKSAGDLYTRFTGHDAGELVSIDKPEFPDTLAVIGDVDGILYTTVRDGQTEKYIHEFKKGSRPLFCVTHDGKEIYMLGGAYDFTERGIVDRTT